MPATRPEEDVVNVTASSNLKVDEAERSVCVVTGVIYSSRPSFRMLPQRRVARSHLRAVAGTV